MSNDKKIWLCEQYAHKAWTLSLGFAQEAGRLGHFGQGYAVVAEEARHLSNKLFASVGEAKFDGTDAGELKDITDCAFMTGLLAVNTMVEIIRVNPVINDMAVNKSMLVLAEDLRRLALDINALSDTRLWQKPFVLPEIVSPLKSTSVRDSFFRFSVGGVQLVENVANIVEVCVSRLTDDDVLHLRGKEIPVLNCYRRFALVPEIRDENRQPFMIIQPGGAGATNISDENMRAVPVDDLDVNTIFSSKIAYAVPPKARSKFAEFSRECWDVVGGDQLIFVDWEKLNW